MDVFTIATALAVMILPVTEPFGYAQDKLRRSGHLDVFYPEPFGYAVPEHFGYAQHKLRRRAG
jgi:hypothetical protein